MLKSIHLVVLKLINEKHKFMNLKKQIKKGSIILLLSMFHVMTFAQTRQVTGVVNDTYGDPMIGVTVKVEGTTKGSITDLDGKFTVADVSSQDVLVVSNIGFINQSIQVGNQTTFNITLEEDVQALEEVVVVGYGVMKRRDVSGAISTVKNKDITAIPTTNALEALQGKVAGMDLTTSSGKAGADVSFTIRGERSLKASNTPLILVDGIDYGKTLDINPSDIESIEVLKDASSTAIYGTRGANGVIIVTTKKGKTGKSKISLNAFASINMISSYPSIMNAEQYARLKREAYRNRETNEYLDDSKVFAPLELEYLEKGYDVDYADMLMSNGFNQNYELSITGGTEETQHFISLGYRGEEGLFKNDDYMRINGRVALDHSLSKKVKIGTNITFNYKDVNTRRDPLNMANKIVPISKPYDDNGELVMYPSPGYTSQVNPLIDDVNGALKDNTTGTRFFGSMYLNWNVTKDLFFRTTIGVDVNNSRRGYYTSKYSLDGEGKDSKSSKNHIIKNGITWENVLTYSKVWGIHDFQVMGGTSTIYNSNETTLASGKDQTYGDNIFHNLASNGKEIMIGSGFTKEKMASFFGRVNYKLVDKYILTASLRADGSSVFAPGKKWGYFPSVALAWRMNDENFLKDIRAISNMKLRLSWGESGQSAIDPYQTMGLLGMSTYSFNNELASGLYPKTMSNKMLSWETTAVYNLGLDFGFFNNRLSGSVDVYKSFTRDILMPRKIPAINGYPEIFENMGETESVGIDLGLNSVNVQTKNFSWYTDFTLSHNKEKIKKLGTGATRDEGNAWFVGEALKVFYDYKKIGIWQLGEEAEAKLNSQEPGDIKVQDTDGDGKITPNDRVVYSQRPDVTFGINNTFNYRDFEFSFFVYARLGQWIDYEYNRGFKTDGLENGSNVNYWTPENPSNDYPRPNKANNFSKTRYSSTLKYEKGSFVKVRDITLAYNLPGKTLKSIGIGKARVYVTAKNFLTFSSLDDYDPERGGGMSFPMTKQLVFGVNLDF